MEQPRGRPKGRRKGQAQYANWQRDGQGQSRDLQQLVEATAKVTLKLADAQQVLHMVRPGSILPTMIGMSSSESCRKACVLRVLVAGVMKTVAEEAMQQTALQAGWFAQAGSWLYKQWGSTKKELVESKATLLTLADLETSVRELQSNVRVPGTMTMSLWLKLQASQPVSADMEMMAERREVASRSRSLCKLRGSACLTIS